MDECDISVLSGEALRFAFLRELHPASISRVGTALAVIENEGTIKVYAGEYEAPKIEVVSPERQKLTALKFFQGLEASFETVDGGQVLFCTINGSNAMGACHIEAGMRAFLLSRTKARA